MRKLVYLLILFDTNIGFSQNGPGGIGNSSSNILWVKSDDLTGLNDYDRIGTWSDESGNGNGCKKWRVGFGKMDHLNRNQQ